MAHALGQAADPHGGGDALVDILLEHTHTCYHAERDQRHEWGYGCGQCPACALRAAGWKGWRQAWGAPAPRPPRAPEAPRIQPPRRARPGITAAPGCQGLAALSDRPRAAL